MGNTAGYNDANMRGDFRITIGRGNGVRYKTIMEQEYRNDLKQRSYELVTNGVVGTTEGTTTGWKVGYISAPGQDGSGVDTWIALAPSAGQFTGANNHVVHWTTSNATAPDQWGGEIANYIADGETQDFKLMDSSTSQVSVSEYEFTATSNIYEGDYFKVDWSITVGGLLAAGQTAGAKGLTGSTDDKCDALYQSDTIDALTGTYNAGAGGTRGFDTNTGFSTYTVTWPNDVDYDPEEIWKGGTLLPRPVLARGTTPLASSSSWLGGNYSGSAPNDGSRVEATFQVTASG